MAGLVSQSQPARPSHTDAHLDTGAFQPTRHNISLQTFQPGDDHNTDLLELLSGRKFSNERISQLLNGSIVTLVQKLLTGREVLRIDGYIQISMLNEASAPIHVHLKESFLHDDADSHYSSYSGTEASLNLKAEHPSGNSYATGERCDKFRSGESMENSCTQIDRDYQTPRCSIDETVFKSEPDWAEEGHNKLESDEESGYSSPCDSVSQRQESPVFNRQFQEYISGTCFTHGDEQTSLLESELRRRREQSCETSGSESSGSPGREEVDNADDDEKDEGVDDDTDDENGDEFGGSRLVIDLLPDVTNSDVQSQNDYVNRNTACEDVMSRKDVTLKQSCEVNESDVTEKDLSMETEEKTFDGVEMSDAMYLREIKDDCGNTLPTCLSENTYLRKTPSPVNSESDDHDDDIPMDLSVDSNSHMETSVSLHAQSVVSQHPDGLECKLCFHVEPEAHVFAAHVLNSHKLLCCTFCFRTFTAKNNLKRHMRIHTGLRPYKCSQCSQSFARRDDFKGHVLRHDYNKPLRCSLCGKGYTDRTCVKKHMVKEHGSRLMRVCPQCGESFDSVDDFSTHKLSHPELEQFACDTCTFIGTNNLMRMKHSLFHSHRLFSCKPCNAHFADPFDYTDHVRKHRATPEFTSYTCCFCEMSLSTYEQFVRHEYSHAQGKTFSCSICQKQFKTKHAMRDHIMTHSMSHTDTPKVDDAGTPTITSHNIFTEIADDEDIQAKLQVRRIGGEGNADGNTVIDLVEEPSSIEEEDCGELLDLSMKKPPSAIREVEEGSSGNVHATSNFGRCSNPLGLQRFGVPRNGYAPESVGKEQVAQVAERVHVTSAPLEGSRVTESTFNITGRNVTSSGPRLVLTSPIVNSFPHHVNVSEPINGTIRNKDSKHAFDLQGQRSMDAHDCLLEKPRSFNRSVSCERMSRPSHRFNPYMRDKMADLASKFVAARGYELGLPKHGSSPTHRRQEIGTGVSNAKPHSNIPNLQLEERPIPFHTSVEGVNNNGGLDARQSKPHNIAFSMDSPKVELKMRNSEQSPLNQVHSDNRITIAMQASDIKRNNNSNNKGSDDNENQRQTSPLVPETQRIPMTCELCQEEFPNFFELESHSVQCHKRFLCQHCGKSFTARPNRDRHVRYHTGERPYKCDLCDLAFFRGDDLKYHRTTRHPTAQPFVCTKCSATFTWGRDLERHHRNSKCC